MRTVFRCLQMKGGHSPGVLPAVQTGGLCQNTRGCLTVSGVTARPQMPPADILQGLKTTRKHDVRP